MLRSLLWGLLLLGVGISAILADQDQQIEATVQGHPITTLDVKKRLALTSQYGDFLLEVDLFLDPQKKVLWRQTLEALIEEKALLYLAVQDGLKLEEEDKKKVYLRLREMARRFGSLSNLEIALKQRGLSVKDIEKMFSTQLLIRKFLSKHFRARFEVRPWELKHVYERVRKKWQATGEVPKDWRRLFRAPQLWVQQIYIGGSQWQSKLRKVWQKLKERKISFEKAVELHSQGPRKKQKGLWKLESEKDLSSETLRQKVQAAKKGEIYLVELENHGIIFRIVKRVPARLLDFAEAQEEVSHLLMERKYRQLIKSLKRRLYKKLDIQRFGMEE